MTLHPELVEQYRAMDTASLIIMRSQLKQFPEDALHLEAVNQILRDERRIGFASPSSPKASQP